MTAKQRVALRRERARARGLCSRCCKVQPRHGLTTCDPCSASTLERVRKKRAREKDAASLRKTVAAHERAGDIARQHFLHETAAVHYRHALAVLVLSPPDRIRIEEKLARVIFLGHDPELAAPLLERVAASYRADPVKAEKAIHLLAERIKQLWADHKQVEALSVARQAVQIADASHDERLRKAANLRIVASLRILGRFADAESYFARVGDVGEDSDPHLRFNFHRIRAIMAATSGNKKQAYEDFDLAAELSREYSDADSSILLWDTYSLWAGALGDIPRAIACAERALLITRQNLVQWRVPYACLVYAQALHRSGQYFRAQEYVTEAISSGKLAPAAIASLAETGIPLALHLGNEDLLRTCADPSAVDIAFASKSPNVVGPVVAAFSRLYAMRGRFGEARTLLRKALEVVRHVDHSWDLAVEVARSGFTEDIPRAVALLETRALLPSSDLARAYLSLFRACVSERSGASADALRHAEEASRGFRAIGWLGLVPEAEAFSSRLGESPAYQVREHKPMSDVLTAREQEVAQLVMKGLTNRQIARQLNISHHTVATHVASIISRLGIRSRYQLSSPQGE